jgi:hypothetical protein
MVEKLIRLIQRVFVGRGIKVIAVTHSPTTVALSPDESIFVLPKTGTLSHTAKDVAINQLTIGLPTLSIQYDARRFVVTESVYDAATYSSLFESIRKFAPSKFDRKRSLSFIGAGASTNGGCAQVKRLVQEFRDQGNKSFLGVVDWDGTNQQTECVGVLAHSRRYALETILLDPLVIAAAIGRDNREFDLPSYGRLPSHLELPTLSNGKKQAIADAVVATVLADIRPELRGDAVMVSYLGDSSIHVPVRYLHMNGHELHEAAVRHFPALKKYGSNEAMLEKLATLVLGDVPELIPLEVMSLFEWLASEEREARGA